MLLPWRVKWERRMRVLEADWKARNLTHSMIAWEQETARHPDAIRANCPHCDYKMLRGYLSCHRCHKDFRNPHCRRPFYDERKSAWSETKPDYERGPWDVQDDFVI